MAGKRTARAAKKAMGVKTRKGAGGLQGKVSKGGKTSGGSATLQKGTGIRRGIGGGGGGGSAD